ncbi:hypothetical protein AMECASPLE_031726 [Ameca splendens]|uniref:HTH lysR-type domain-containing protein n=1 Tax=Ameca splendens TaxID=208324 RepID=A0ABV0XVB6_9TELE
MHREKFQTPCRKTFGLELNPQDLTASNSRKIYTGEHDFRMPHRQVNELQLLLIRAHQGSFKRVAEHSQFFVCTDEILGLSAVMAK